MYRLRDLIDSTGLPRQAIADEIGCDVSMITKHYNSNRGITPEFIVRYARYFGVTTDYILGLSDVKSVDQDIRAISDKTGLDDEAIAVMAFTREYVFGLEKDDIIQEMQNNFIKSTTFQNLILFLVDYQKAVEKQYELLTGFYNEENESQMFPDGYDQNVNEMQLALFRIQEIAKDFIKRELREKIDVIDDISEKIAESVLKQQMAGEQ